MTTPPVLPNAPRMGAQVTKWIRDEMSAGYTFPVDHCLQQMHLAAGLPYGYDYDPADGHDPWAIEAFEGAHYAVHETDPAKIPTEVYVFFESNAPNRPGHICWDPHGGQQVLSTDWPHGGHFNETTIPSIERAWNMHLVGYSYDLNEHMVGRPPAAPAEKPEPMTKPDQEAQMRALLKDLTAVCVKHGVTRVYGARVLLWGASIATSGARLAKLKQARQPLVGMDEPKAAK